LNLKTRDALKFPLAVRYQHEPGGFGGTADWDESVYGGGVGENVLRKRNSDEWRVVSGSRRERRRRTSKPAMDGNYADAETRSGENEPPSK
jgi:hypothetical protein